MVGLNYKATDRILGIVSNYFYSLGLCILIRILTDQSTRLAHPWGYSGLCTLERRASVPL
jgi:hypothetical protein